MSMECRKTKIVLDADVIIHFIEADCFSLLPDIFPEYEYVVLDVVYNEVAKNNKTKGFIEKRGICAQGGIHKGILPAATDIGKRGKRMYGILQGQSGCFREQQFEGHK